MMAQGHVDFVLSVRLTPWDHAAGALVVQQSGGVAKMLDGRVYSPTQRDGYMLAARNSSAWSDIQQALAFLLD
jgi:fructose-1,6-bisphosphatase/inositol monophosphatase family enzyme